MNFHTMSSSYYAEKKYIWVIDVLSIPGVSLEPLGFSGYPKRLFDILVPGEHRETNFFFCLFVCFLLFCFKEQQRGSKETINIIGCAGFVRAYATAFPKENTSSCLITVIKSCWIGLIFDWVTIPVYPVRYILGVRLALCSFLSPPTSAKSTRV